MVQKFTLAEKAGALSLALRSAADKDDSTLPKPTSADGLIQARAETHATAPVVTAADEVKGWPCNRQGYKAIRGIEQVFK